MQWRAASSDSNVTVAAMPGCSPNSWPRTGSRRRAQGVNQGTVGDSCGKRVARGSARSSMTLGDFEKAVGASVRPREGGELTK